MDLRYPIGKLERKATLTEDERAAAILQVEETPLRVREAVAGFSEAQFNTPYRPDGWSVRQLVHHLPDAHMNSYIRFKLALTEEVPIIHSPNAGSWADLGDSRDTPIQVSLSLLEALHARWVVLMRSMRSEDFGRKLVHPKLGEMTLDTVLGIYSWHGRHHVAHITALREREGWN